MINVQEINNLATLPGKEALFSKLLFLINAPATRLATVMNATGRNLAVVVDQAVQANKFTGTASASSAASATGSAPVADAAPAAEAAAPAETPVAAEASTSTDADPAQPESGDVSQAGAAATEPPVEG